MSLASFTDAHFDQIMLKWESRMRQTVPSSRYLSPEELHDHLADLLKAIVHNLDREPDARPSSLILEPTYSYLAHVHGAHRRAVGFDLKDILAEYSALRAAVLELWCGSEAVLAPEDLRQIPGFDQAIDRARRFRWGDFWMACSTTRIWFSPCWAMMSALR